MSETKILPFTLENVVTVANIHPKRIRAVYIYGSQVYGTAREGSDYDIIVVAPSLLVHTELKQKLDNTLLNIHIYTPDKFQESLSNHKIMNLECFFAPDWAKMQIDSSINLNINPKKLIKSNLAQSFESWRSGKMKLRDGDIYRGLKSIFHSLRMLMFAIQILEHGKIIDYSIANNLYTEINDCDEIDWDYFKEKYLPLKIELEEKLKSYGQ